MSAMSVLYGCFESVIMGSTGAIERVILGSTAGIRARDEGYEGAIRML